MTVSHRQVLIWRNYVNMIGFYSSTLPNLDDRDRRAYLQYFSEFAFMFRRHVQDHDVRDATVLRHVGEELFERLDTAGRGTEPDNQEVFFFRFTCRSTVAGRLLLARRLFRHH